MNAEILPKARYDVRTHKNAGDPRPGMYGFQSRYSTNAVRGERTVPLSPIQCIGKYIKPSDQMLMPEDNTTGRDSPLFGYYTKNETTQQARPISQFDRIVFDRHEREGRYGMDYKIAGTK